MSEPGRASPTSSHLPPLLLWLALQLLALALAALQVPLSDEPPRPIERLAIHEMLIVQVLASAMLFPMLFRNIAATIALVASAWPFLQLAAMLSATPASRLLSAALYVTTWMLTLAVINSTLISPRARVRGAALATSLTLAGPLLWYLNNEFGAGDRALIHLAPIPGALHIVNGADPATGAWIFLIALLATSLVGALMLRRLRRKCDNLSTAHPQSLSTESNPNPFF